MSRPNRPIRRWSRLGFLLVENLSPTSVHVSYDIHELWRAVHLYGFGKVRRNSSNSSSVCVLV